MGTLCIEDTIFWMLLSSNWGQNFTPGYKICNLVVTYEQNIEALMLQEEVHLVM